MESKAWWRYFLGCFLTVLVVLEEVVLLTGLPVASTGLLEVAAAEVPTVLDRFGAILPELPWPVLLVEVVPAERLPVAGVVCACAVALSIPATKKARRRVWSMASN